MSTATTAAPDPEAPRPDDRVTLHVDVRALLKLAAGYAADKKAGKPGFELALMYLKPAFDAVGYPLPEKIHNDVELVKGIIADVAEGTPTHTLVVRYLGPIFQSLGSPIPPEILGALQLGAAFLK